MEQPKKKLAKPNIATRQDSLNVYNSSVKTANQYIKAKFKGKRAYEVEKNEEVPKGFVHQENDRVMASRKLRKRNSDFDPFLNKEIKHNYRNTIDSNRYTQKEAADVIVNTSIPGQLFDRRIEPRASYSFWSEEISGNSDAAIVYSYNSIANKPFDLLTPKEKEQRVKQFGRSGVPSSYALPTSLLKAKAPKQENVLVKPYQKPKPLTSINQLNPKEIVPANNTLNTPTTITQPARTPKSYQVEEQSTMPFGSHSTKYEVSDINNITAGVTGTGDKRKITPKYADGGSIDPPIKTVKEQAEFNNNWFANRVINNVPINVKSRVAVPETVNISNLNPEGAKSTTYGQYNPQNKSITFDSRFKEKTGIPAHEQYHEFQDNLKEEDKDKYNKYIENPIQEVLKNKNINRDYDADPEEISARLQQLRWGKDFKPNQVVTPKDIEQLDTSSYDLQNFDKEEIVKLLNTVASNTNPNSNSMKQYAKRFLPTKGKYLMKDGGRLPYSDRHIAPSALIGGAASVAGLIPGAGTAVSAGLSLVSGLLGKQEQEKEARQQEYATQGQLITQQAQRDAIAAEDYDTSGNRDVKYYADGGVLPTTTGQFNTKGGKLVPISSDSEVAVGNTHGEKTIDNSYGITLEKGNTPIAEIENEEVVKDGQKVYSDRLMFNSTQTFADKAKQLGIKAGKIETKLSNTKDVKDRNGLERTLAGIKMGEEVLYQKQEAEKQVQGEQELNGLPVKALGGNLPYGFDRSMQELNKYLASTQEKSILPSGQELAIPKMDYTPTTVPNLAPIRTEDKTKDFLKDLAPTLIDNVGNAILTANTPKLPKPIYNPTANIETEINVNPQLAEISNTANTIQDNILSNSNDSNAARANIASSRFKAMQAKLGVLASKEQGERGLRSTQNQISATAQAGNNAKLEDYNNLQFARKNEISSRWSGNLANLAGDIKDTQTRQDTKEAYNKMILADLLDDTTGQKLKTFMNNPSLFNLSQADREALLAEARRRKANSMTKSN